MNLGVNVAKEFEGEAPSVVEVSVVNSCCLSRADSFDDFIGAKDFGFRVFSKNSVDLFFEAVIVVHVSYHDRFYVGFAFDWAGVEAGVDDDLLVVLLENQAGVLVFCDLHAFIVSRVLRLSKTCANIKVSQRLAKWGFLRPWR